MLGLLLERQLLCRPQGLKTRGEVYFQRFWLSCHLQVENPARLWFGHVTHADDRRYTQTYWIANQRFAQPSLTVGRADAPTWVTGRDLESYFEVIFTVWCVSRARQRDAQQAHFASGDVDTKLWLGHFEFDGSSQSASASRQRHLKDSFQRHIHS
jgi:hypothetical protein